MIYVIILQTIGNTPVVRLNRMGPDHVELYVKVESFNPLASVKDRLAFAIINDAEQRGTLEPGQTVIEATSGNTGIALAMVCAATGHQFVATMGKGVIKDLILDRQQSAEPGWSRKQRSLRQNTVGSWRASSKTRPTRIITPTLRVRKY